MLLRFSLYTVLRNQQFYAPFIILALRDAGLSFAQIGALYTIQSVAINALEIPSGLAADRWGRRRTLGASMLAYCASFLLFGLGSGFWTFAVAMALFGLGEAFRSGTHKAMIYQWLKLEGRADEKVTVYGRVRAWGKVGAGANVILAGLLAAWTGSYPIVFLAAIGPYLLNALNVLTYPAALEGPAKARASMSARQLLGALWATLRAPVMRGLLIRSAAFEGLFKTTKDYVQPMIRATLPAAAAWAWIDAGHRATVAVSAYYLIAYLLSSVAALRAGRVAARFATPLGLERFFWIANLIIFAGVGLALLLESLLGVMLAFLAFMALQSLWKPINTAAFADAGDDEVMAAVLSVQSQAKSVFAGALAPLLGLAIDHAAGGRLYPVALLGLGLSAFVLVLTRGGLAHSSRR